MTKHLLITLAATLTAAAAADKEASPHGTLVFHDTFDRTESQEKTDEPGNGWGTNSNKRAKGNKQVDLADGAMRIFIHEEADHAVSVTHPAEFTDGTVAVRFKLDHPKDNLGLNFADLKYKAVHAGHLFIVRISPTQVQINDLKTGNMDLKIRTARLAGTLTDDHKALLQTKQLKARHKLALGEWHEAHVTVKGDTISVSLNGQQVAAFTSEGIAHPTKRTLRLSVPRQATVDDVRLWRRN